MAKQIYNFEVFTNKKDELRRIQKKQKQKDWTKRIFLIILLVFAVIIFYVLNNSRCGYYIYKEETETENNDDVAYETFGDGYIKYSRNGIEYQKKFGVAEWNIPVSFQNPILSKSDSFIVLADKGSNVAMLFDVNGKVREFTLKYPVVQMDVADNGILEVILQAEDSNFIQMYDKEGNLVADMKSSVDKTGYPMAASVSSDGTKLAVSYFAISGMSSKTTVAFYDFSQQLQTDDVTLIGGFDYEDTMIAKLKFTDKDTLVAFGESKTYYYDVSDEPKVKKEVSFDQEIQSIFLNGKYIGYVLDNSENVEEGKYLLYLYTDSGAKKMETDIDMDYESIDMKENQIIAIQDNQCTIINTGGKILYQGELEGSSIEEILPVQGWRTYQVIFSDKIVKMKLRFWGNNK